jgi:sugar lactone lactonase YvrE
MSRILLLFSCLLLFCLIIPKETFLFSNKNKSYKKLGFSFQQASIKLVGPNNDPNPVVNEASQLKLTVLDNNNNPITQNLRFESDSPEIATIDQTGMVTGLQQGYATITVQSPIATVSNFVAVARVNKAKGRKVLGDTKVGSDGSIYISDPNNHVILKKDNSNADITVFAGQSGMRGKLDGQRNQAQFAGPLGVAVDNRPQGGIYIADTLNNSIRKIDFSNNVVSVLGNSSIGTMSNDITPFSQAVFRNPQGVALANGGNLVIADTGNNAIYLADFSKQEIRLLAGSPGNAGKADGQGRTALFNRPVSVSVNPAKTSFFASSTAEVIFVADAGNNVIRSVSFTGEVKTLGPIANTSINPLVDNEFVFNNLQSISLDTMGNIYVVDQTGVKVITNPVNQSQRQMISLAQPGVSFGQATSVVVQGTRAFVLDSNATSEDEAVKVVTIGAPKIDNLSHPQARIEGGEEIIITGSNFAPDTQVVLGDQLITDLMVETARRIRIRVPSQQSAGDRTLTVQTRGGMDQRRFTILPKPLAELATGEITTIAGGIAYIGDAGQATNPEVALSALSIALDDVGNMIIADDLNNRVRKVDVNTGIVTTIAGSGRSDFSGDGAIATAASLNSPQSVTIDTNGNIFIADTSNNRVRKIDANTNIITTIAGNGIAGFDGDNEVATNASLDTPTSVTVDKQGNIFIADSGNNRIRRVDTTTSIITTVVGNGRSDFSGDGGPAFQASLSFPIGIFLDNKNNLLIADSFNNRIRRVDNSTGNITSIAGTGDADYNGDNILATGASLNFPSFATMDGLGNIFISDTDNSRVRKIDVNTGMISTVAGNGQDSATTDNIPAINSTVRPTEAIADGFGNLFIADQDNNRICRVDVKTGLITTIAGNGKANFDGDGSVATSAVFMPVEIALDNDGDLLIADRLTSRVRKVDFNTGLITSIAGCPEIDCPLGDGGAATNARLSPLDIAVDKQGNIFIADGNANRIRKIDNSGTINTVAGSDENGFGGDGGQATQAKLNLPNGVALDLDGNILIADSFNSRIRKVDITTGTITTIGGNGGSNSNGDGSLATKAGINFPVSITVDGSNNLYITDALDNLVRRIDANTGIITRIAGKGCDPFIGDNCLPGNGGPAQMAGLNFPLDTAIDGNSDLFVAEAFNNSIRQINAQTGVINGVVGNGMMGFSGDGMLATKASLNLPFSIAIDKSGNLLIADLQNGRVRAVKAIARAISTPRAIMINTVNFQKPNLTISGVGFTVFGAKVVINNKDISKQILMQSDTQIILKGNKKKLNLKKGANQVIVTINGVVSNNFTFNF